MTRNTGASTFYSTLVISKLPKVQYSNFQYSNFSPFYLPRLTYFLILLYFLFKHLHLHYIYIIIYIYIYTRPFNSNTSYKTKKYLESFSLICTNTGPNHYHVISIAINERLSCYHPRRPHVLSQRGFLSSS